MNKYNYDCNICKTILTQHKTKKKYFFCETCQKWFECFIPMTDKQMEKAIAKIRRKGYDV